MNSARIQPYFVMSSFQYYKSVMNYLGISHFYSFTKESIQDYNMIAVPDGCIDILFSCSEKHPIVEVCGSVLVAKKIPLDKHTDYFGVRFYPGSGYLYNNIATKDLIDNQIPITEILEAKEMVEQIITASDFTDRIRIFLNHYTEFISNNQQLTDTRPLKNYLLKRILETRGNVKVSELAEEVGYTKRYIHQKFVEYFGISPKVFCRITRFQSVLTTLNTFNQLTSLDQSLLHVSTNAGYYDQAHMIKDFSLLSQNTPSQYLKLLDQTKYYKRIILV